MVYSLKILHSEPLNRQLKLVFGVTGHRGSIQIFFLLILYFNDLSLMTLHPKMETQMSSNNLLFIAVTS